MAFPSNVERPANTTSPRRFPEPRSRNATRNADLADVPRMDALPPLSDVDIPSVAGRDFASALDLIREASEAIHASEERANDLADELALAKERADEQIQTLEGQAAATDRRLQKAEERARAAEARASAAETWLIRIHDAVTTGFKRPLSTAPTE